MTKTSGMTDMDKLWWHMDKLINDFDWGSNVFMAPAVWFMLHMLQLGYAIGLETSV